MNVKTYTVPTMNLKTQGEPAINVTREKYLTHLKNIWDGDTASTAEIHQKKQS